MKPKYIYLIAACAVALDQAAKWAVVNRIPLGSSISVIHGMLDLTSVRNPGGAFGTFQSSTGLLTVITLAVAAAIVFLVRRPANLSRLVGTALGLLLGGAVGNLIDRIRLHYVIDFIDFHVWPVFNVSDIVIAIAMILLAWHVLFVERSVDKDAKN